MLLPKRALFYHPTSPFHPTPPPPPLLSSSPHYLPPRARCWWRGVRPTSRPSFGCSARRRTSRPAPCPSSSVATGASARWPFARSTTPGGKAVRPCRLPSSRVCSAATTTTRRPPSSRTLASPRRYCSHASLVISLRLTYGGVRFAWIVPGRCWPRQALSEHMSFVYILFDLTVPPTTSSFVLMLAVAIAISLLRPL